MRKPNNFKLAVVSVILSTSLIYACDDNSTQSATPVAETLMSEQQIAQSDSDKANALFEKIFMDSVMRSPMTQSYLGIKQDQDKWDDISESRALEDHQIALNNLALVKKIDASKLDSQTKTSLQLMTQDLQNKIDDFKWRHYNYPLNQMYGLHSSVPSLLINQHQIKNQTDAEAYIARMENLPTFFNQVINSLNIRAEEGIIAPKFVYPYVIQDSKNIITGAPFTQGEDSTLLADFKQKVKALKLESSIEKSLIDKATKALNTAVKPAYEKLITNVEKIADKADTRDGAWKFPDGQAFYNNALKRTTTTDMTAEQIHQLGLEEVARIHDEMKKIMKQVQFEGSLPEFFDYMRHEKKFYLDNTAEGRAHYISEAESLVDDMKSRLDQLFIVKPKADLTVKAVEPFREKSAGKAFYQQPSMDGSRPGIFYANLYQMGDMPTYQMAALVYHEGIPGHHMQIAIAQELQGLPRFRKFGRYTAYTEGWGLYSEVLPKEIGLYQDPYSDFGRLSLELWRACRLVVDTGIHAKQWTREEGIDYYMENTPNPKGDAIKMVERHIVMPSQATAYKVGMLKIMALREKAKRAMGDKFDIRKFHNVVLKNGPLPLNLLEEFVDQYIADK